MHVVGRRGRRRDERVEAVLDAVDRILARPVRQIVAVRQGQEVDEIDRLRDLEAGPQAERGWDSGRTGLGVCNLPGVALGAGSDFLSPIGHQSNTLVMGPGGYHFADYWKLGLPISLIVVGIGVPLIVVFWPPG